MKTTEESYIEYICCNCKNKDKDLCDIRTRYDNTTYCNGYDTDRIRKRKTLINWQGW